MQKTDLKNPSLATLCSIARKTNIVKMLKTSTLERFENVNILGLKDW